MNQEQRLELARQNLQAANDQRIAHIRQQLPQGESATHCTDCGVPIPEGRRNALPGVQRCIDCQERNE